MENLERLIGELCTYPNETGWIEFKHNNYDPHMIGKDISALANSAALMDKSCAYMAWGIDDKTHEIIGTDNSLQNIKIGAQELENWLRSLLSKNVEFEFHSISVNDKNVSLLIIYKAAYQTVMFQQIDYIRVGSYTKKLNEYPELQAKLWDKLRSTKFEERYALQNLELTSALQKIDYPVYFETTKIPLPTDAEGIAHYMFEEKILVKQDNGMYAITNLGAVLFGKRLSDFDRISRKAIRVVQYDGNSRINILKTEEIERGYVPGFEGLMKYLEALIPSKEVIEGAKREKITAYPLEALREAIANALIHQDFAITGAGPTIELFDKRIEITNPGIPLVDIKRIIDTPPHSRNEKLASLMKRLRMCEELGTGWDRIVVLCELNRLPAPKIEVLHESTRVTLFSEMAFTNISPEEKLWACYLHACIQHVQGNHLTNSSLRERFGVTSSASASISRLIKEAVEIGLIKPLDPTTAPRYMKYIPAWA